MLLVVIFIVGTGIKSVCVTNLNESQLKYLFKFIFTSLIYFSKVYYRCEVYNSPTEKYIFMTDN